MATIIKTPHKFHCRLTLRLCIYIYKVGCKSRRRVLGTKSHKKGEEILGLASTPRQDVIHKGLSVSRGRPAAGSGCFVQTGLETTRTSPNRQAVAGHNKPY